MARDTAVSRRLTRLVMSARGPVDPHGRPDRRAPDRWRSEVDRTRRQHYECAADDPVMGLAGFAGSEIWNIWL